MTGFVWEDEPSGVPLPAAWRAFSSDQTLQQVATGDECAYRVLYAELPPAPPSQLTRTVLEEMAWALVSRPACDAIAYPLYTSLVPDGPPTIRSCPAEALDVILERGYLVMCRPRGLAPLRIRIQTLRDAHRRMSAPDLSVEVCSRALLEQRAVFPAHMLEPPEGRLSSTKRGLRAVLGPRGWAWLKRQYLRVRAFLEPSTAPGAERVGEHLPLALRKTWAPAFARPEVNVQVPPVPGRVPVWIALHWLELGGAEKFAIDLIQALPKDRYAVYVTTDVPSENPWAASIRDDVEELLHLPRFLSEDAFGMFCEYYVRTRQVRLLHINHAPRVYESLSHMRRLHPALKVLQTLHILEMPPHSGGYPEWAMADFGVFIDHHHVISEHLKRFLGERWLVPDDRIDVIRINVDARWFDPARVPPGLVRGWFGIPDRAVVVGFIGRLAKQKRPLEFVRMARLLTDQWRLEGREPALHFIMAGDGELREEVERAIRDAHLEHVVHLMGETADARPVYVDCDLLAMPSENEGLALVTYEAMAMATPIFFTDVGAQSELLGPQQLVAPEMPVAAALADRIWPYLLDPERRRTLGEQARARIVTHHAIHESVEGMIALYGRLLDGAVVPAAVRGEAAASTTGR